MPRFLFDNLVGHFPILHPEAPIAVIDENTFELRIPPVIMTARYDPTADIVFFNTREGAPAGYFRIVEQDGAAKFLLDGKGDPLFIDQAAKHLVTLIADYAPALQHAINNPR